ncbi:MAG: hypothetical protein IKI01_06880 [Lachnospiraceae bacterium]|nr:hypothetical protein [Lachnospiraceae bacterium]
MRETIKTIIKRGCPIILILSVVIMLFAQGVSADEEDESVMRYYFRGDVYQLKEKSGYNYSETDRVDQLPFGRKYAGDFYVTGDDVRVKSHRSYTAYGTTGSITFGYSYDNSLKSGEWHLCDDGQESVNGNKLSKDVDSGAVIIEKSYDMVNWTVEDTWRDFFSKHPKGETSLYTTEEDDVKRGVYYRVTIAYKLDKVTENPWYKKDDHEYVECVEVYSFYVGDYRSQLHLREIYSGDETSLDDKFITYGFSVMCDSTESMVYVKGPEETSESLAPQYSVFTKPGKYSIRVLTALEDEFKYEVAIREGVDVAELSPVVYECNDSYEIQGNMTDRISSRNMTSLFVEQMNGYTIKQAMKDDVQAVSVNGEGVALYLQLNHGQEIENGWELDKDSYGSKDGQKVYGIVPGEIATGALIIQTSQDGANWTDLEKGRYKDGLYTTDFQNQYGSGRRIQIYTPNGQEVLNGLYVRVVYAYQIIRGKETKNIVEEYTFFLSNSNVDAVAIHNLSVEGKLQEILSEEDQNTIDIYKKSETLADYTQTLTGFKIDTSLNPTVQFEVKRDGQLLAGNFTSFTQTGKYEITLNAVGATKKVHIYVDRTSAEESLKLYFGEGFLIGKRVYAETGYPVYVANQTSYNILKTPDNMPSVCGSIQNITTGSVIDIASSQREKTGVITEPGEYVATLYTNRTFTTGAPIGDTKVFTFRFIIIGEDDTPGPILNQIALKEYATTNISDLCPRYYGLTYSSAGKGLITLAFATWEDAYRYAYENEKGNVEKQEDGSFCYRGEFQLAQKEKYESTWALTDAIDYFARQSIREYYFDMSDDDSYVTLPQEILDTEDNLKRLELSHSVIVFAEGQKEKMLAQDALPIVSPKKYALLEPGLDQPVKRGEPSDFQFIKDKYEYDSRNVVVIDCNDNTFPIQYHEGVGKQLEEAGCASGTIRFLELNKYDDQSKFEAVFIRSGENLAKVTIKTYRGEREESISIDMNTSTKNYQVDAFMPVSIVDSTDPYSYIKIVYNGHKECFLNDAMGGKVFFEPGDYTIRCINRLGYYFEFTITIRDASKFAAIRCEDDKGTVKETYTYQGTKNVSLPVFERTGYKLVGYVDKTTKVQYPLVLAEIDFTGNVELEAVWEPKECKLVIVDQNANRLKEVTVRYHDIVDLNKVCADNEIDVISMSANGVELTSGTLMIESEGETIVVATITEPKAPEQPTTKRSTGKWVLTICIIAVCVAAITFGTWWFVKKGKKHEEN